MSERHIPTEKLTQILDNFNGNYGVYVSIPSEGKTFELNGDQQFSAASTIKIPMLALLFQDAEDGRIDLNEKRVVLPENRVGGSGILQSLSPDLELSIFDLAELMIVMSDNTATNEIIDVIGLERLRGFCRKEGYEKTWAWRKMFFKGILPEAQVPEGAPLNATTAADLGHILEKIAEGKMVSPQSDHKIVQIMAGQQLGKFKKRLPCTTRHDPRTPSLQLPDEGHVVVACKGGSFESLGILHDAGIFYLPDGRYYVMTVCTQSEDMEAAEAMIGELGLAMYEAMK